METRSQSKWPRVTRLLGEPHLFALYLQIDANFNPNDHKDFPASTNSFVTRSSPLTSYQLYAHWANFHCNEAHIIAKVSARRESLHLFGDLMTQFKSGQFTAPIHSF